MNGFLSDQPLLIASSGVSVESITRFECAPWILERHYAKRWPPISYAFGLFDNGRLQGICTFGKPSSAPLRSGIAGAAYAEKVIELNRLCCVNSFNNASFLIGRSIRLLPPCILISFADPSHGHLGTVYQATNWIYTGLSEPRTDWKVKGLEHLHGQTVADMVTTESGQNRAEAMRRKFGDKFYLKPRPRKHRYILFHGSKTFCREARAALRYPVLPYPKAKAT